MVEALAVERGHTVLQIGAGSGYATAILAHLAGAVIGLERCRSLAESAATRLAALGIDNAEVVWGDGLTVPAAVEAFDRIIVHGALTAIPDTLRARMAEGGLIVAAVARHGAQRLACATRDGSETILEPCALQPIVAGLGRL